MTDRWVSLLPARARLATIATLAVLAAACNGDAAPKGQVIAVVNGEEITSAELNHEARARSLPIALNPALRDALVQELIDRKLLVGVALDQNLDETPDYLLTARRLTEIALAQQLLAARGADAATIPDASVERFVAANPMAFQDRLMFSVDRISLPPGADPRLQQALAAAPDVDAMQKIAAAAGVNAGRATETWDSATLPNAINQQLRAVRPSETFVLARPDGIVAGKMLSVSPAPVPREQHRQFARAMIEQQQRQQLLEQVLRQLRAKAEVRYQPDYAPGGAQE